MKSYLLETSIVIDYLRGKQEIINLINSLEGNFTSSYFCLAEIFEGVYRSKDREKHKKTVLTFFKGLHRVFDLDEKIAEEFGRIRKELKAKGKIIEDIDIFIAATCIVNNLTIVTLNTKHFSKIESLEIFNFDLKI